MGVWTLSVGATFLCLLSLSRGEIRCHCNGASCVASSYMCKSSQGCYSQLSYGQNSGSIHGCVESLAEDDQRICQGDGDILRTRTGQDKEWPILMCCKEDMCNYMGTRSSGLDVNIYVNTRSNGSSVPGLSHTSRKSSTYDVPRGDAHGGRQRHQDVSEQDLWFKAAVIAVPIAGGFILILLVLLAVRMLRNDSRRHRQLVQLRQHHSMAKAQLYVADHFSYPCDHKSLCPHPHRCHQQEQRNSQVFCAVSDKQPLKPVYKDVSINIDPSGQGYERMSDSSGPDGSCNSIIVWNKPGKAERVNPVAPV